MLCEVTYYPYWSSKGMRGVKCGRPAKFTVQDPPSWSAEYVCGTHARVLRNYDARIVLMEGTWIRA
jgi:hypothetical protein